MIFDRRFLLGVVFGGALGAVFGPQVGNLGVDMPKLKNAILAQVYPSANETEKVNWPTNDEAKRGLFLLSKWDLHNFGEQSTVNVERCIRISEDAIACQMRAKLSWLNEEARLEGVFKGKPEHYTLVSAKSTQG